MQKIIIKGNNKITELRAILQRESQNSYVYKQTKSVNNRKTVKTVIWLICRKITYVSCPKNNLIFISCGKKSDFQKKGWFLSVQEDNK